MDDFTVWVQGVSPQRAAAAWLKGWEIVLVIALMEVRQGRDQEPAKQAFLLEKNYNVEQTIHFYLCSHL